MGDNKTKNMANRPSYLRKFLDNFWKSVSVGRHIDQPSNIVGHDHIGNRYHEIPADPKLGRHRPRRWYTNETSNHHNIRANVIDGFDSEIPTEWESWLRFRRQAPPTEEQVMQGYALAD